MLKYILLYMLFFISLLTTGQVVGDHVNKCVFSDNHILKVLDENLNYSNCFPFYFNNKLIYYSSKPNNKDKFLSAKKYINGNLSKFNNGPIWISDTMTILTTNCNEKYKKKRNLKLEIILKDTIYTFPYCNDSIILGHGCFDKNTNRLYFISNSFGSLGETDLFYSIFQNNSWQKPVRLGNNLNTLERESFPYVYKDYLYFTSEGHEGYGAMDLYRINLQDLTTGKPENLGDSFNSEFDDFAINFKDQNKGFFTSNRFSSAKDKIYSFELLDDPNIIHCSYDCENSTCVSLSIDSADLEQDIYVRWLLAGRDTLLGESITYCFSNLGEYNCRMQYIDKSSNNSVVLEKIVEVFIKKDFNLVPQTKIKYKIKSFDSVFFHVEPNEQTIIKHVKWNFGDGNTSTGNNIFHEYKNEGFYEVRNEVYFTDSLGLNCCKKTMVSSVLVVNEINNKSIVDLLTGQVYKALLEVNFVKGSIDTKNLSIIIKTEGNDLDSLNLKVVERQEVKLMPSKNYIITIIDKNTGEVFLKKKHNTINKTEDQFKQISLDLDNAKTIEVVSLKNQSDKINGISILNNKDTLEIVEGFLTIDKNIKVANLKIIAANYFPLKLEFLKDTNLEDKYFLDFMEKNSTIRLDRIYFSSNSHRLEKNSFVQLYEIIDLFNEYPNLKIQILAHTDNIGSDKYNLDLSERRAKSVELFFKTKGIAKQRFSSIGYGEDQSIIKCINCTKSENQQNRRIEFKILEI